MEFRELIDLFERASRNREWGNDAYVVFYNDGSGEVYGNNNDEIFGFDDIEELIEKLEE